MTVHDAGRVRRRHSVRAVIYAGALGLALLPLVLVALAYAYEQSLVRDLRARLGTVAAEVLAGQPVAAVARKERVEVLVLDGNGATVADSGTGDLALSSSLLGPVTEWLVAGVEELAPGERMADLDRAFGPPPSRDELAQALAGAPAFARRLSPSAQTVLFALAVPRPDGGAVYLEKGSRRGIRRLIVLRGELAKLAGYELGFALVLSALLGRWLATPLARLARAARRYPSEPLADRRLLERRDELGDLARAMTALASDLEERRRHAADLGADVAHEFKNPLATIAASAELIGTTREDTLEKRALVASHIGAAVERLRRSIDALLALLRLEVSLPDERRERLDYAALLDELLGEYRRDPRWADFALSATVAPDARVITVVPRRWAELLRNLVDNALVQPSERRAVIVEVTRADDRVVTRVRDFGGGVSAGNRENIFRRFYSQRPDGAQPGTGLGLSIVQAIAAAHGGQVALEPSTEPGACFAVTLPDAPA
jgi:two-component system sensor histidine kinase ChvG